MSAYAWYLHGYALGLLGKDNNAPAPLASVPDENERAAYVLGAVRGKDSDWPLAEAQVREEIDSLHGAQQPPPASAAAPKVGIHINIICACGKVQSASFDNDSETAADLKRALAESMGWSIEGPPGTAGQVTTCPACTPQRERSTFSTGPEAAQRWQSGAPGEHARTEEIAAVSRFMENPPACCRDLTITGPGAITEDGHHRRCPTKETP